MLQEPPWAGWLGKPGGMTLVRGDGMADVDRRLLAAVARVVLPGDLGDLVHQLERPASWQYDEDDVPPSADLRAPESSAVPVTEPALVMKNGIGGFTPEGREYVVVLDGDRETPLPWSNVLANPTVGTIVSSSGSQFTWAGNSRENRLTPFANDPLTDPTSEAFFVRDDESRAVWGATPTPLPRRPDGGKWVVRHAAGVTRYQHAVAGMVQELTIFVAPEDPVKFAMLTLTNDSGRRRHLSVFGYAEWCLGPPRGGERRFVVTEREETTGALLARNRYNMEHGEAVAFLQCTEPAASFTGDRTEFVGRNRTLAAPAALFRQRLASRTGAGLDACGALQLVLVIEPGESRRVVFTLGEGHNRAHAVELAARYASLAVAEAALKATERLWETMLTALQVRTPDDSFDLIVNRWLLYQSLACRIWARSGPISLAARSASAISCRTRWRCCTSGRTSAARICCRPHRGSSWRATCSTGGIRRAAAAPERAVPTISSGCRMSSPLTSRTPETMPCSTRRWRSSKRPCSSPISMNSTSCLGCHRKPRRCSSTACARSRTQ